MTKEAGFDSEKDGGGESQSGAVRIVIAVATSTLAVAGLAICIFYVMGYTGFVKSPEPVDFSSPLKISARTAASAEEVKKLKRSSLDSKNTDRSITAAAYEEWTESADVDEDEDYVELGANDGADTNSHGSEDEKEISNNGGDDVYGKKKRRKTTYRPPITRPEPTTTRLPPHPWTSPVTEPAPETSTQTVTQRTSTRSTPVTTSSPTPWTSTRTPTTTTIKTTHMPSTTSTTHMPSTTISTKPPTTWHHTTTVSTQRPTTWQPPATTSTHKPTTTKPSTTISTRPTSTPTQPRTSTWASTTHRQTTFRTKTTTTTQKPTSPTARTTSWTGPHTTTKTTLPTPATTWLPERAVKSDLDFAALPLISLIDLESSDSVDDIDLAQSYDDESEIVMDSAEVRRAAYAVAQSAWIPRGP